MADPVPVTFPVLRLAISITLALLLAAPPGVAEAAGNVLASGETLGAGRRLAYGGHSFLVGDDCDLALDGGVWQSGTAGRGSGCSLTLEGDGRLVVRSENGATVWESPAESDRRGEHVAVLEPRGRVTVYGPAVSSGAELGGHQLESRLGCLKGGKWDNCIIGVDDDHELLTSPLLLPRGGHGRRPQKLNCLHGGRYDNCIINGAAPAAGNVLFSGRRRLRLRGGCDGGHCFLRLDSRGGLAVVDGENRVIWTNGVRSAEGDYVAVVRGDREVAVYGPATWSTAGEAAEHHRQGVGTSVNRKIGVVKMVSDQQRVIQI